MIKPFDKPIYVTQPFLPNREEFCERLAEIWESRWLTNNGPIVRRFEKQLSGYFETDNLCLFNNGTLALQIALQGMGISGEVITTPYTFVATSHALFWNKVRPVFVDIEPDFYTIDPQKGGSRDHTVDDGHIGRACLRPPVQIEHPGRYRPQAQPEAALRLCPRIRRAGGGEIHRPLRRPEHVQFSRDQALPFHRRRHAHLQGRRVQEDLRLPEKLRLRKRGRSGHARYQRQDERVPGIDG